MTGERVTLQCFGGPLDGRAVTLPHGSALRIPRPDLSQIVDTPFGRRPTFHYGVYEWVEDAVTGACRLVWREDA